MKERVCSHTPISTVVLEVRYCARCCGWQYWRAVAEQAGLWRPSDSYTVLEQGQLDHGDLTPEMQLAIVDRVFRNAWEMEQDRLNL